MKRVCLFLLCIALLICIGCSRHWSDEKGHIFRDDIDPGDFAFLFNKWEYKPNMTDEEIGEELLNALKSEIKQEDIFDALGLPCGTTEFHGVISYSYLIGDKYNMITIKYVPEKGVIDIDPEVYSIDNSIKDQSLFELWSLGGSIEKDRYNINKRYDIKTGEFSFIDEETTSQDIQKKLGAPHYYIELKEANIEDAKANIFVYNLECNNVFKVIYFREGYILKAWIEDKDGNELEILIDRDMRSYYENN